MQRYLEWTAGAPGNRIDKFLSQRCGLGPASIRRIRQLYVLGNIFFFSPIATSFARGLYRSGHPIPTWLVNRMITVAIGLILPFVVFLPFALVVFETSERLDEKILENREEIRVLKLEVEDLKSHAAHAWKVIITAEENLESLEEEVVEFMEIWNQFYEHVEKRLRYCLSSENWCGLYLPEGSLECEKTALVDAKECLRQLEELAEFRAGMEVDSLWRLREKFKATSTGRADAVKSSSKGE